MTDTNEATTRKPFRLLKAVWNTGAGEVVWLLPGEVRKDLHEPMHVGDVAREEFDALVAQVASLDARMAELELKMVPATQVAPAADP